MPKDVKRAFRKIAKRFFMSANDSASFSFFITLLSDPFDRYIRTTDKHFLMPKDKTRLIQFINGL